MGKEAVISEVLALPDEAQREILALLKEKWGEDEVELSGDQLREQITDLIHLKEKDPEANRGIWWNNRCRRLDLMLALLIEPRVKDDLSETIAFYDGRRYGLELEFLAEVKTVLL